MTCRRTKGWFALESSGSDRIRIADEPTFRFAFKENRLQLANDNEEAAFEIHYKFKPEDDRTERMLVCSHFSKSGRQQFLESVTATGGIAHVIYERTNCHPPRLPDLSTIEFAKSFSFDQPYDGNSRFIWENEFLLKTPDGKFALLHFEGDLIKWVFQPDGSVDIDRRRKRAGRHCEHCQFRND